MSGTGLLDRYAAILELLAGSPEGLTLSEISAGCGFARATAHRLIGSLQSARFVRAKGRRKLYVLGDRLLRLIQVADDPMALSLTTRPILERLSGLLRETAFVAKLVGERIETVLVVTPADREQSFVYPGRVMPVHAAASGKAILAFQSPETIRRMLERPRERFTTATLVEASDVLEDLRATQARGYAVCDGEFELGVLSFACPILLRGEGVLYSVGVVAPVPRLRLLPRPDVITAIRSASESIATRLNRHFANLGDSTARLTPSEASP